MLAVTCGYWESVAQNTVPFGARADSFKFAVIGDMGTGARPQYDVAQQMVRARARFPFELVLMTGDNMYGRQEPGDFEPKFERPYRPLLDAGVRFYAVLGNHDERRPFFHVRYELAGPEAARLD
jgi:hypothetical protein